MPRLPRIHVANAFYHATLRGNHRQDIFREQSDRSLLDSIVARSLLQYDAHIHAYCWMTNHLHFLIQVGQEPLGSVMRQIASGYARAFQQKIETTGHLFERRYYARMVPNDSYLLQVIRYIHLNPIQACMARHPGEYPWSSHFAYAGSNAKSWLTTEFALAMFAPELSAARAAYRRFMAEGDPAWTPADEDVETRVLISGAASTIRTERWQSPVKPALTLEQLVDEACDRFDLRLTELSSPSRDKSLVLVRGWIAREALGRRVSNLSELSRFLGKDRATLRYAMRLVEKEGQP